MLVVGCGVNYQPASDAKQFDPSLDGRLQTEVETQTDGIEQTDETEQRFQTQRQTEVAQPPAATVKPAYIKDSINSLAEVRKRMRATTYVYENDLGKDASLLPFFTITAAQKSELKSRSSTSWDMVQYWTDIANDNNIEYPRLWKLRPDKSLTGEKIFAQILALPTETHKDYGGGTYKWTPTRINVSGDRFYLPADTEDVVIIAGKIAGKTRQTQWVYRGRKINPDVGNNKWHIESFHPNFNWMLHDTPANPVFEYILRGRLHINGRSYGDHPDAPFTDPIISEYRVPSRFNSLDIFGRDVFGSNRGASNDFKQLSFMDALDVAINWIVAFEHAYGVIKN